MISRGRDTLPSEPVYQIRALKLALVIWGEEQLVLSTVVSCDDLFTVM